MSETYFYLIATKRDGQLCSPVKIGISNSVPVRFDQLRTASPYQLELVFWFAVPRRDIALAFEQAFLKVKASKRMRGEWLDLEPYDALLSMCCCIQGYVAAIAGEDQEFFDRCCEKSGVFEALRRLKLEDQNVLQ